MVAYPGDRLLVIGCRTDRRHDWQTRQTKHSGNAHNWVFIWLVSTL